MVTGSGSLRFRPPDFRSRPTTINEGKEPKFLHISRRCFETLNESKDHESRPGAVDAAPLPPPLPTVAETSGTPPAGARLLSIFSFALSVSSCRPHVRGRRGVQGEGTGTGVRGFSPLLCLRSSKTGSISTSTPILFVVFKNKKRRMGMDYAVCKRRLHCPRGL